MTRHQARHQRVSHCREPGARPDARQRAQPPPAAGRTPRTNALARASHRRQRAARQREPGPARLRPDDDRLAAPGNVRLRPCRSPGQATARCASGLASDAVDRLRSRVNRSVPRLVCSVFARVLRGPHGARRAPSDDPRGAEIRTRVYRSCIGQVAGVYRSCIGDHARQARTGKAPPLLSGNPALRPGSRVRPVPGAAAHAPLGLGR